ncbi:MAGUK p55 sub member 5 [Clonorchis sinensis]|uniref:MAGUK p55 sub member 5 n=1 Tax=Clonorchis sinensis TaxID=79923 RepID=A0A8T1MV01_CLOSI|nr:MAGUK p55 sub member 5 [Clonorchis sinensis]
MEAPIASCEDLPSSDEKPVGQGTPDEDELKMYASEVKKRLQEEKEHLEEELFLRSSLRGSDRLKALEKYRRIIKQGELEKHAEYNEAFECDDEELPSSSELAELIRYLQTKVQAVGSAEGAGQATDADQWEWLLGVLSDPLLAKGFLMHDRVASAYETCKQALDPEPRYRWPVLPGMSYDVLEAVQTQLLEVLQRPVPLDAYTVNHLSHLHSILGKPRFRSLFLAMDGLANTWLFEAQKETEDVEHEAVSEGGDSADDSFPVGPEVEPSVLPGCYATLAYDENGRDSYSEQGVRLKYVVFQKGDNEFLGATVRVEKRSILIARIINGGLAQKTNLLHEGDELLTANGIELLGKDLKTATEILASLRGRVVLLVAPASDPYAKSPMGGIIHLRALFSYDPDEDRYLACHELGLSFTKGDILHVTGRRDPNWWQAYRSDEETGITGAVGTLAGLIPSPVYQRHRAVLRLQSWLNSGSEDVELEDEPSDLELESEHRENKENVSSVSPISEKRFLGIKLPFGKKKSGSTISQPKVTGGTLEDPGQSKDVADPDASGDTTQYLVNSTLINSIYDGRMSGQIRPSGQLTEGVFEEWAAAGPVWGQHGYDVRPRRERRARLAHKTAVKSPCLSGIRGKKKGLFETSYFPSVHFAPDSTTNFDEDPVAWLDKEVAAGYLPHSSLWTYEPVAQYIPQPLRRRPLVFVGPAHVGRHQLMQNLISVDPARFCPAPIHTTNSKVKSDSSVPYIVVSDESFEADRKRGEFIEWGMFNRARYGTSKSTLQKLVDGGKVVCITLRPESLRLIRASGLMPYVIFISPPERVDELRRIQKQLGLKVNCSDMELKMCIETSRKMEVRFGHWFDIVVIPDTIETTVNELTAIATQLERQPSWVPRYWSKS